MANFFAKKAKKDNRVYGQVSFARASGAIPPRNAFQACPVRSAVPKSEYLRIPRT